jgi:SAM-dependent methyltransferase
MTFQVLGSYADNTRARAELRRRGVSYWPKRPPRKMLDVLRNMPSIEVGELNKSWEILLTLDFLEAEGKRDGPIVDLGCYASEILCVLHMAGFRNLYGVDLNPRVTAMPFAGAIKYRRVDMMDTGLPDAGFAAVLAMSSIEHGFALAPLVTEVARLLRPGGVFIGSTDYWKEKLDTNGITMFGMDWRIFSETEIRAFFGECAKHGLYPTGPTQFDCREDCIECGGKSYTFGWFALRKGL